MADSFEPASMSLTALLNLSKLFSLCFYCIFECKQKFLTFRKSRMLLSLLVAVMALQNMTMHYEQKEVGWVKSIRLNKDNGMEHHHHTVIKLKTRD